jgi:hypothetical protein
MSHPGLYPAVIQDTNDPQGRGRVTLLIPDLFGDSTTGWAEPVATRGASVSPPSSGTACWATFRAADKDFPLWFPTSGGGSLNIDGGSPSTVFLGSQVFDGGTP